MIQDDEDDFKMGNPAAVTLDKKDENATPKKFKKTIIILSIIAVLVLGIMISFIFNFHFFDDEEEPTDIESGKSDTSDKDDDQSQNIYWENGGFSEPWYDIFGNSTSNIPYVEGNTIENTYKSGGRNFISEIGDIHEGKDYQKTERNIYDLYIPYSALQTKNNHHGVLLFIHGGAWVGLYKETLTHLASRYAKMGYITANMGYTLLSNNSSDTNIFRILDEIGTCLNQIKIKLGREGFSTDKLEFAVGGYSAGAHLALLFAYTYNLPDIKIKFVIDIVGPISLDPEHFYSTNPKENPLENIEDVNTIKDAIGKVLIPTQDNESYYLTFMNAFTGNKFTNDLYQMLNEDKNKINKENEKYQEMYKIAKHAFPINKVNTDIPVLCEYCGNDGTVGAAQFAYLKKKYIEANKGDNIELVYMRFSEHITHPNNNADDILTMKKMHYKILSYMNKYFTKDN